MTSKSTILAVLAALALSTPVWANEGHEGGHEDAVQDVHCDTDAHEEGMHTDCAKLAKDHVEGDGHDDHDTEADGHETEGDGHDHSSHN